MTNPTRMPSRPMVNILEILAWTVLLNLAWFALTDAYAATYPAANCSSSAVAAAVALTTHGDIVTIPACGRTVWTSTVNVSTAITIQGAGTTSGASLTQLAADGTVPTFALFVVGPTVDQATRITGIYFDLQYKAAPGPDQTAIHVYGKDYLGNNTAITQLRIDHNKFTKGRKQLHLQGWVYGVIDNNSFANGDTAIMCQGDDTKAWERPIEAGTANAIFIEDNTFTVDGSAGFDLNEQIYHQEGLRSVTRYNAFVGTANGGATIIYDAHGNFPGSGNNGGYYFDAYYRGEPILEFYNNTIAVNNSYRLFNLRGSSLLFHDNTMTGAVSNTFAITDEEVWASFFIPNRTAWPAQDQVTNAFFWNNTLNGAPIDPNPDSSTFFQIDRDIWLHAPAATGGKTFYTGRVGGSQSAPTNGTTYPLDTGTLNFTASGPNAYYPYTPYCHPHPIVSGIPCDGAPPPPTPPFVPGQFFLKFAEVLVPLVGLLWHARHRVVDGAMAVGAGVHSLAATAVQYVEHQYWTSREKAARVIVACLPKGER